MFSLLFHYLCSVASNLHNQSKQKKVCTEFRFTKKKKNTPNFLLIIVLFDCCAHLMNVTIKSKLFYSTQVTKLTVVGESLAYSLPLHQGTEYRPYPKFIRFHRVRLHSKVCLTVPILQDIGLLSKEILEYFLIFLLSKSTVHTEYTLGKDYGPGLAKTRPIYSGGFGFFWVITGFKWHEIL